jgi:Dna[CI] antecedent, DciA
MAVIKPAVPLPKTLAGAMASSDSLAGLAARLRESNERFEAVAPVLPEGLARGLQPGPIDDEGWTILASNAAVAAKLRHLLPRLTEALRTRHFRELPIRVRLASRR